MSTPSSSSPIPNTPLARHAMAYVLAGGRGSRLMELTDKRAKPAVYFGGKSRIIDFALSNALNSGIRRIGVATQYKAHSLIRHLQRGWNFFRPERNESFDILPASQRVSEDKWYLGTADAVYQNIDIIESYDPKYIVLLAGDHIYKMDYEQMLQQHVEQDADVTVGCLEVPREEATGFGVMHVDENDRSSRSSRSPRTRRACPASPTWRWPAWASTSSRRSSCSSSSTAMPPTRTPRAISARTSSPTSSSTARRWRTASRSPACGRAPRRRPTGATSARWTPTGRPTSTSPTWCRTSTSTTATGRSGPSARSRRRPSSCMTRTAGAAQAISSLVSGGCIVSGASLRRVAAVHRRADQLVLGRRERGGAALCRDRPQRRAQERRGRPRACTIPEGLVVGEDPVLDAKRFRRTDKGICLITQTMIDRLDAGAAA